MNRATERIFDRLDWHALPQLAAWTVDQAVAIQQIPAPTFQENKRAEYVREQFITLGLTEVDCDDLYNVYGLIPGTQPDAEHIMIVAHTDTVFPMNTDLRVRRESQLIYGPGLGDNSVGVAGLLALARYFREERVTPGCNLWFVATSREEGLGDLGGMKSAYARLQSRLHALINLEGLAFGHIYNGGIAVRRLHIVAQAEGGHSWLHFGRPSAIHALMELGSRICAIKPPATPRTTYNIGIIGGGTAINAIAADAHLWLDLRSESADALEQLEQQVRQQVRTVQNDQLPISIEVVGDRPAGILPASHPLVQDALTSLRMLGIQGTLETGSTDANVALADGRPAITIGITRGGNAHRLDEYIETESIMLGLQQLILLTLSTAARAVGVS